MNLPLLLIFYWDVLLFSRCLCEHSCVSVVASGQSLQTDQQTAGYLNSLCIKTISSFLQYLKSLAQPVRFSHHQESDRNICVHEGSPIVLRCELSHDPSSHVDWTKDGIKLLPQNNMETNSEGLSRTLHIHSAEQIHAGIYECSTSGHTITFEVDVKGDSPLLTVLFLMFMRTWCDWLGGV